MYDCEVFDMTSALATRWRLSELMARHKVSAGDLAEELRISANAVSSLRNAETLPKIGGKRLDEIAEAITKLSGIGGKVRGIDLLEDFDEDDSNDRSPLTP